MLELRDLNVPLDAGERELRGIAARQLGIAEDEVRALRLLKRSVDARRKNQVHFTA